MDGLITSMVWESSPPKSGLAKTHPTHKKKTLLAWKENFARKSLRAFNSILIFMVTSCRLFSENEANIHLLDSPTDVFILFNLYGINSPPQGAGLFIFSRI